VLGRGEDQNEYVERDVLGRRKKQEYAKMSMRHFQDDKRYPTSRSCLFSIMEHQYGSSTKNNATAPGIA